MRGSTGARTCWICRCFLGRPSYLSTCTSATRDGRVADFIVPPRASEVGVEQLLGSPLVSRVVNGTYTYECCALASLTWAAAARMTGVCHAADMACSVLNCSG